MYWNVPRIVPCAVRCGGVVGNMEKPAPATIGAPVFANPKSSSFAPALVSMTLPEVAVDDARAVCCIQSTRDLNRHLHSFVDLQGGFFKASSQCLTFEVFHHQEVDAVLPT